ncbi:MAG: DUF1963 domain-containing protein [Acidimicrobiales bacterium]|nr:DUF1963 domain-containing protein [Acidimicrobiales bacterium]
MNRAERLTDSQFRFSVLDLEVGPLDIPELLEVGSRVSVLEPARSHTLSLEFAGEGFSITVVDADGAPVGDDGLFIQGSVSQTSWSSTDVRHLVVTLAPWVVMRSAAHRDGDGSQVVSSDRPQPAWEAQLALVERVAAHHRDLHDGDDDSFSVRLRDRIEARRRFWPDEPPVPGEESEQEAKRWGPQLVRRTLEAIADAGVDKGEPPFEPAMRMVTHVGARYRDVPLGASHVHGFPHLPDDFSWPEWDCPGYDLTDEQIADRWGHVPPGGPGPLTFVAQIDLAEVPFGPWWAGPRDGHLVFFVDFDRLIETKVKSERYGPGGHRVIHIPAGTPLSVRVPEWTHPNYGRRGWKGTDHEQGVRYIGYGKTALLTFEPIETVREVELETEYLYDTAIAEQLRSELQEGLHLASHDWHWIGGAPNPCQPDPLGYALRDGLALTSGVTEERGRWMQLLQIASDWDTDTIWGDVGLLHVFIRATDLAAGRFDRTLIEFQCS